jgi:hypothetical protein
MQDREHYGNALKLRVDLWRLPLALCLATLLLFLITVEGDRAASRGAVTLPGWISTAGSIPSLGDDSVLGG